MYIPQKPKVLVIGCGVSGLTTADVLLRSGFPVEIWGREPSHLTTSTVAAAVWLPYEMVPRTRVALWAQESYHTFGQFVDLPETGVLRRTVRELLAEKTTVDLVELDPVWVKNMPGFGELAASELPAGYFGGHRFTSYVIEMPRYLAWLRQRVQNAGATIVEREVTSLTEVRQPDSRTQMRRDVASVPRYLAGSADIGETTRQFERSGLSSDDPQIIVNCAGLGGRELNVDPSVYPKLGQVVRTTNPGIEDVVVDADNPQGMTYIIPRSQDCILGGTSIRGVERAQICAQTTNLILERCRALDPRLNAAEVLDVHAGLRPCRPEVCLMDVDTSSGQILVHNYGHGGVGVTLSWGCAFEVAQRLKMRGYA